MTRAAPIRGFRIVRREAGRWFWLRTFLLAAIGSILVTALLFAIAGADVLSGFEALIVGSVGSKRALVETLTRATPLILTGVGTAVAYRARIWNIGAEGQLFAGAMAAYWANLQVSAVLPLAIPIALVAGFAGGALYAGFAGWLKVRFAVQEVISTVLLNYIILFALSLLLLDGPWSDPGSFYQRTPVLPEATWFPLLVERSHLHIGFLVALIAAVVVEVMITRTAFGFELRAFGYNPYVLALKGTSGARMVLVVMAISGGLCGLAGVGEVYGVHHRLLEGISPGLGYSGIMIAVLAGLNPLGVVVAAILFGGLDNASITLPVKVGVPSALSEMIQGVALIMFVSAAALSAYTVRRSDDVV
jgi:simple sugar transport system permease protein